ncbi:hypothetical protein AAHA92_09368 [Salvia divinorum]|uniref:Ubiquitin-like protease family profile domain-containing protein n=1 Tax=Salvia divinorum TaxID=28513 RepID=A0ABD1HV93_SALDI
MKVYTSMAKGKTLVQNDACTHNANKPSLRSRSNMGAPEMLRSPFNDRAITMGYHLAVEEKEVYYWVLSTKNEATELIVYNNHGIIVTHEDIASLVPYCKITVGLFITSAICTYTIVQPRAHWNEKMAMSKFRERILYEFKYIGNFQLCAYNLIFFPIYASDHHYLVCFNFLKPAMTIIDSAKPPGNDYGIEKYGDVPAKLKKYFLHMLEYCNNMKQASALRKVEPAVLPIQWTTATNKSNSGVYVMRHMETYMAQKVSDWKYGITSRSALSLQYLRAKISKALLFGNSNALMGDLMNRTHTCYEEAKKKGPVDVEKMIATYTKD